MERAFAIKDMKSFECSSPSELDRKFFTEQSLMSVLSLDQLSTSRVSNETGSDGCEARHSGLALLLSPDPISPSPAIMASAQDKDGSLLLAVPLQGNSSTPCVLLQKQQKAPTFDQSFGDLAVAQMSWDLSLIKSESSSPRLGTEPGALESTWSPNPSKHVGVYP